VEGEKMLYATTSGRILTEEDVNLLSPQEIDREGVHVVGDWDDWN
jgi:hypothetical protein